MAPRRQTPSLAYTRTLAFPASPFSLLRSFFFLSLLFPLHRRSFAPSLFLSLATVPCDLSQRAACRHASASRPRDVLRARRCCFSATNPRRVPSQQATLRRRVTAGGHFQYGGYAHGMRDARREEARPPSYLLPVHPHRGVARRDSCDVTWSRAGARDARSLDDTAATFTALPWSARIMINVLRFFV